MQRQEIEMKVCESIKGISQFGAEEGIGLEKDLRENYGIDSIALVTLLVELEGSFGITFDSSMLTYDNFSTAGAIAEYISKQLEAATNAPV